MASQWPQWPQWPEWDERPGIDQLAQLAERLNEAVRPGVESWQRVSAALAPVVELLPEYLGRFSAAVVHLDKAVRHGFPENWLELDTDGVLGAADLITQHGINVVWVPRAVIVRELIAAPDHEARENLLVVREREILDDVASLNVTTHPALAHPVDAVREAVTAFEGGHTRAAQALAAVALSALIHDTLGEPEFGPFRKKIEAVDLDHLGFEELRLGGVLRCVARAIYSTDYAGPGFNRHSTAHFLRPDQYTRPNAVAGLMLVAGLVRELDRSLPAPEAA